MMVILCATVRKISVILNFPKLSSVKSPFNYPFRSEYTHLSSLSRNKFVNPLRIKWQLVQFKRFRSFHRGPAYNLKLATWFFLWNPSRLTQLIRVFCSRSICGGKRPIIIFKNYEIHSNTFTHRIMHVLNIITCLYTHVFCVTAEQDNKNWFFKGYKVNSNLVSTVVRTF